MAQRAKAAYHHGDLRTALLAAAEVAIAQGGVGAVSLRDLARTIGVSSGAPFHHFKDKTELIGAIAAHGFAALHAALTAARETERSPRAALAAMARAYHRFARSHPGRYRAMFAPEATAPSTIKDVAPHADACFALLEDAISSARPSLKPQQRRACAIGVWCALHGLADLGGDGPLRIKVALAEQEKLAASLALDLAGLS